MCVCMSVQWLYGNIRLWGATKFIHFPRNDNSNLEYSKASITPTKELSRKEIRTKTWHVSICIYVCVCVCLMSQLKQMTSVQKSNLSAKVTHWQLRTILKSLWQGPAFYCQCRQFHIGYGPTDLCEYPTPVLPKGKLRLALATNLPDRHDPWRRI